MEEGKACLLKNPPKIEGKSSTRVINVSILNSEPFEFSTVFFEDSILLFIPVRILTRDGSVLPGSPVHRFFISFIGKEIA